MAARSGPGESGAGPHPTRRGVILGAAGLAGLGGMLAGCSTAAVPYGANEAGVAAGSAMPLPAGPATAPLPGKQVTIVDGKIVVS